MVYAMLFASAWTAAITVVAGLVLAQEGGYERSGFHWHKWMGVALCFFSTLLLVYHRRAIGSTGRDRSFFQAGLSVSLAVLIVTGHFVATLTHVDHSLFDPLCLNPRPPPVVSTALLS